MKHLHKINFVLRKKIGADTSYIFKNLSLLSFGTGISTISALIVAYIFGTFIEPSVYGQYKYILATIGLISAFSLTGASSVITSAVSRGFDGVFFKIKHLQLKIALMPIVISVSISIYYFSSQNYELGLGLLIFGIVSPISQTFLLHQAFLAGKKDFKLKTLSGIFLTTTSTLLLVTAVLILEKSNVLWAIAAISIPTLSIPILFYIKSLIKHTHNMKVEEGSMRMCLHLTLLNFIPKIANNLDKVILFQFLGATQLAIFAIASAIPRQMKNLPKDIQSIILPKISQRSLEEINNTIAFRSFILFLIGLSISATYILTAPAIFNTFLPLYAESVIYTQIFSLILLATPNMLYKTVFLSQHIKRPLYLSNTIVPISKITILLLLLPSYGLWAAIFAVLTSLIIEFLILASWFHLRLIK